MRCLPKSCRSVFSFLPATFLVLSLGCAGSAITSKPLPGGEPDETESIADATPLKKDAKTSPTKKRITIPDKSSDTTGLEMIVRIEGMDRTKTDYNVKAGTSFLVNTLVRNFSSNSVRIAYGTDQRFDVVVFSDVKQKNPVFRWGEHRTFDTAYQEMMVAGGTTISRMLEVPTTNNVSVDDVMGDDLGKPLTPGTYYLWATHEGDPFLSKGPITIVVEP